MKYTFLSTSIIIFIALISSCCNDDPSHLCSKIVQGLEIEFPPCNNTGSSSEIFIVAQESAEFMSGDEGLEQYFVERMEVCGIDEIQEGTITLIMIVEIDGTPCIDRVILDNVFEKSVDSFESIINQMPKWVSAKQMGTNVRKQVILRFYFLDGKLDEFERVR